MNSKENWALKIDHDVYKNLAKIPSGQAEKILNVIENLPSDLYFLLILLEWLLSSY